jgi:flagellar biosynthesis component FlhA
MLEERTAGGRHLYLEIADDIYLLGSALSRDDLVGQCVLATEKPSELSKHADILASFGVSHDTSRSEKEILLELLAVIKKREEEQKEKEEKAQKEKEEKAQKEKEDDEKEEDERMDEGEQNLHALDSGISLS